MNKTIDRLVDYCVHQEIIQEKDIPWFRYGISKRVSSVIVGVPFFCIAVLYTDFNCAVAFFTSFFLLKRRTGGYHANSLIGCLLVSLLCELSLFVFVYPLLERASVGLITQTTCIILIFILAPYNHPNLDLSKAEIHVCRKSARIRACFIGLSSEIALFAGCIEIMKGLTMGMTMASFLCCLGYITEWRVLKHGNE